MTLAVRASIRTSYDALLAGGGESGQLAARAFRMLGLLQVPDVAPPVVAAMLAEPDPETARTALDRLVDAQLVEPVSGSRYRLHDLVRMVAAERASEDDTELDHDEITYRAIVFYTCALWQARGKLRPNATAPFGGPPLHGRPLPTFAETKAARSWIDLELTSLIAVTAQAASTESGVRPLLWLAEALWECLDIRCEWPAARRAGRLLVTAAERLGAPDVGALGYLLLGRSEAYFGSYENATDCLEQALGAFRRLENVVGVALALNGLGVVHSRRGEPEAALIRHREALEPATQLGLTSLAASALNNISVSLAWLGRLDEAIKAGERSASILATGKIPDPVTSATTLLNISVAYCLRGDQARALRAADQALRLSHAAGDRMRICEELIVRSEAYIRARRPRDAYADAENARSLAHINGYAYALAAAESQLSKILTSLGRIEDAASAAAHAQTAFARLSTSFREPLLELLLAGGLDRQGSGDRRAVSTRLAIALPGTPAEAAVDGALNEGRDSG